MATSTGAADPNYDPFQSIGGGVYVNGGWQPKGMASAQLALSSGTGTTAPPPAGTAPAPITTAQQISQGTTPVGATTPAGAPSSVAQSLQQGLVNRLNPGPVDASNPAIAPAIAANNLQAQRQYDLARNDLAELNAGQGTNNSGGMNSQILGLRQNLGQQEGQFAGQAVQNLQGQQNQNQTYALSQALGLLTGQQNLAQQAALAQIQADLQKSALEQQGQLGQGQLNLGLLSTLLGNQQAQNSLSAQMGEFGAGLDSSMLLGLLGGLA